MPTRREREYYRMGYEDGLKDARKPILEWSKTIRDIGRDFDDPIRREFQERGEALRRRKPKRKLSAWNKYVKNKRNHIRYRDGKLNLKKMAVAFRRKKRR